MKSWSVVNVVPTPRRWVEWKQCRHFTSSPSSCLLFLVSPSLTPRTTQTQCSFLKFFVLLPKVVKICVHCRGFQCADWIDQRGFSGVWLYCHRRRWLRIVRRSKLRVYRLSVFFSQTRSSLGRFRLFCFNLRSACWCAELWVQGRNWYR